MQKKNMKKLGFEDMSMLYTYIEDPHYAQIKSDSVADRYRFKQDTLGDALRINMTLSLSIQRTKEFSNLPLAAQLEACSISEDEILGLEHLVLESPKEIYKRRAFHVRAILLEQVYQETKGIKNIRRMSRLSTKLSNKSTLQARARAARDA